VGRRGSAGASCAQDRLRQAIALSIIPVQDAD
jgi:hypothetical protein